jgi:hypothetical protein
MERKGKNRMVDMTREEVSFVLVATIGGHSYNNNCQIEFVEQGMFEPMLCKYVDCCHVSTRAYNKVCPALIDMNQFTQKNK